MLEDSLNSAQSLATISYIKLRHDKPGWKLSRNGQGLLGGGSHGGVNSCRPAISFESLSLLLDWSVFPVGISPGTWLGLGSGVSAGLLVFWQRSQERMWNFDNYSIPLQDLSPTVCSAWCSWIPSLSGWISLETIFPEHIGEVVHLMPNYTRYQLLNTPLIFSSPPHPCLSSHLRMSEGPSSSADRFVLPSFHGMDNSLSSFCLSHFLFWNWMGSTSFTEGRFCFWYLVPWFWIGFTGEKKVKGLSFATLEVQHILVFTF